MFEAISDTAKISEAGATMRPTVEKSAAGPKQTPVEKQKDVQNKKQESSQEISQEFLKELEQDIEMIHNVGLQFSVHKDTGRTMVRVMNKDNGRMIREVPPREILDLAAKLNEMIGILFDKTI